MTLTPRWPVVLFDLDGTLANTIELIVVSYQHAFWQVCNREIDPELAKTWIGRTLRDVFTEVLPDHVEELERVYRDFNETNLERLVTSYDGIAELLTDLQAAGATTGVVTAKGRHASQMTLRSVHLDEAIKLVVTKDDTTLHKPDPAPLLKGAQNLGVHPRQCVYVGDAIYDLQAAAAADMAGIGVTWGAGTPQALRAQPSRAVVDDVTQLRQLLLG